MENFQRMLRVQIVDTPFRSEIGGIRGFQSLDLSVNRTAVLQYRIRPPGLSTLHFGGDKITSATKATAPGCIPDYEPFPFRQRKKRRKVGPFSKRLSFAMLDLRTQEGRYARDICDGIAADLGGAPNAAQQVLCQMFALKILRVQLLVQKILSGETVNLHTANYASEANRRMERIHHRAMSSGLSCP
ncbi:MAG: hypothetical protein WBF50_24835 [Pseudolabrys sp.]